LFAKQIAEFIRIPFLISVRTSITDIQQDPDITLEVSQIAWLMATAILKRKKLANDIDLGFYKGQR